VTCLLPEAISGSQRKWLPCNQTKLIKLYREIL